MCDLILGTDFQREAGPKRWWGTPLAHLRWPFSRYKRSGFPELICRWIGADPKLPQLKLPFVTAAVDLNSFHPEFFANSDPQYAEMRVSEVLHIAVAVPGLYPPVEFKGQHFIDGAFATLVPICFQFLIDPLDVLAMTCTGGQGDPKWSKAKTVYDYLTRTIEAALATHDQLVFGVIDRPETESQIAFGRPGGRISNLCIPASTVRFDEFDLSIEQKRRLIVEGAAAARHWLVHGRHRHSVPVSPAPMLDGGNATDVLAILRAATTVIFMKDNEFKNQGDVNIAMPGSIQNVKNAFSTIVNDLRANDQIAESDRSDLIDLVQRLEGELVKLGEDNNNWKTRIASEVAQLSAELQKSSEKRNPSFLTATAKGLVEASSAVAKIVPTLYDLAERIAQRIASLNG